MKIDRLNEPPPATQPDYYFESLSRAPHRISDLISESAENVRYMRRHERNGIIAAAMIGALLGAAISLALAVACIGG